MSANPEILDQIYSRLQQTEDMYQMLLETADVLIARATSDGTLTYLSPSTELILGYDSAALLGQSFFDLVHPEDLEDIKGMKPGLLHSSTNGTFTLRVRHQDGTHIWLEINTHGLKPDDDTAEIVMVGRDVTERKLYEVALQKAYDELEQRVHVRTQQLSQANEQLKQEITERKRIEATLEAERADLTHRVAERTAELSRANAELSRSARLKDEFLASMSHELRTPLNAILGMSEALQESVYGPVSKPQSQALNSVTESGRHLLALINDILDVSKIEAGKLTLNFSPVYVRDICDASLRFIKQTAQKKRITVSSNIDGNVSFLLADERRLKQMLVNLLSNAMKFTPDGGSIGLDLIGDVEKEQVEITVWDTGIGISAENMAQLFKPFIQLDSSLSRRYNGTGLGLTLVERMTEMHGGRITVESNEGQGSQFTLTLPWQPDTSPETMLVTPIEAGQRRMTTSDKPTILIIEDSPITAEQYERHLQSVGLRTIVYRKGGGAAQKAIDLNPDLIILDILLPDLSGWDVLKTLKSIEQTKAIPVLIASVTDERASGLALGAVDCLVKPISRQQLQEAVQKTLPDITPSMNVNGKLGGQPARPVPEATKSLTILLAEDNEINITTTVTFLEFIGHKIIVARNGVEAVQYALAHQPDVILMDIQMPEMDGLDATREIRREESLVNTPVIALTALAMAGDRERCLEAGADDYMSKPVNLKNLSQMINEHANKKNL